MQFADQLLSCLHVLDIYIKAKKDESFAILQNLILLILSLRLQYSSSSIFSMSSPWPLCGSGGRGTPACSTVPRSYTSAGNARTCTKNPPREKTKLSELNQPRIQRTNFKRPNGIGRFNPRRCKSRFIRRQGTGMGKGWKAKVKAIEALARSPVLHLPHISEVDLPVGAGHVDLGGAVVAGEVRSTYSRRRRRMESSGRRKGVESTLVGGRPRSPHALVAKVPPPSRRVCSRRGGGAGAKGWRVCGTHLSARVVMVPPAERRGADHGRATLPLRSF
jgi:hypothetical protein